MGKRKSSSHHERSTRHSVKARSTTTVRKKNIESVQSTPAVTRSLIAKTHNGESQHDDSLRTISQAATTEGLNAVAGLLEQVQSDSGATIVLMHHLDHDMQKKLSDLLQTEPHLHLAEKVCVLQDELARAREDANDRSTELQKLRKESANNDAKCATLEKRTHQFFQVTHGLLVVLDAELNVQSMNRAGKEILGFDDADIVGKNWVDTFVVKSRVPEVRTLLTQQLAGNGRQPVEYPILARGGEERIISWKSVVDTSETPSGLICSGEDISILRKLNIALQMSEERLHLVMESEREDEFFIMDTEGYIVTWISRPEAGRSYRAEEMLGKHFSAFYAPDDFQSGKPMRILDIAEKEGRFEEECWRIRKDDSRMRAYVIIMAIRDDEGKLLGFSNVTRYLRGEPKPEERHLLRIPAHLIVER